MSYKTKARLAYEAGAKELLTYPVRGIEDEEQLKAVFDCEESYENEQRDWELTRIKHHEECVAARIIEQRPLAIGDYVAIRVASELAARSDMPAEQIAARACEVGDAVAKRRV